MEENNEVIKLVAKPKIAHKLNELGASVTQRIKDLNLENLVATEETVKSLKELRADLNKELESFEEQRKFVKNGILNPYNEFEALYKIEISEKYAGAINILKDKIAQVENKIKQEKRENIKRYFDELCISEGIDFIPFEKTSLDINLSTSEKAYKTKCSEFITRVIDDLNLIKTTEYEAEILTEYKISLNASLAITTVRARKENEKIEAERLRQVEINRRIKEAVSSGLPFDDFSKTYIYNDQIFIPELFIKESSKEDFSKKLIECQEKIKVLKSFEIQQGKMDFSALSTEPIHAPNVKDTSSENLVTASFKVTGTMAQLQSLGKYMRENNITYTNI